MGLLLLIVLLFNGIFTVILSRMLMEIHTQTMTTHAADTHSWNCQWLYGRGVFKAKEDENEDYKFIADGQCWEGNVISVCKESVQCQASAAEFFQVKRGKSILYCIFLSSKREFITRLHSEYILKKRAK